MKIEDRGMRHGKEAFTAGEALMAQGSLKAAEKI